jgi:BirA family biotin operon repressor/biotin-[acetyl-CoA-carboxylase] ligase
MATDWNRQSDLSSEVLSILETRRFGRLMTGLDVTDSTNSRAAELAMLGTEEGAVVVAEHQTKGRGRFHRRWHDQTGHSLTFSVVLYPDPSVIQLGQINLAAAVAVVEAIGITLPDTQAFIKWPNDVLISHRKVGGILSESRLRRSGDHPAVILGIGININQDRFPDDIASCATSLRMSTGRSVDRARFFGTLLGKLENHYDSISADGGAGIRNKYMQSMLGIGETASMKWFPEGRQLSGTVLGIDNMGGLRLRIDGRERTFAAGEITFQTGAGTQTRYEHR